MNPWKLKVKINTCRRIYTAEQTRVEPLYLSDGMTFVDKDHIDVQTTPNQ